LKSINDDQLLKKLLKETRISGIFSLDISEIVELFLFKEGEYLIHQGEYSEYLYFLASGRVKVFSTNLSGNIVPFGYYQRFRVIGEVSLLWGKKPDTSVQAVEKCYCFGINLEKHRHILLNDNSFLRYICKLLCSIVKTLDNNMAVLMFMPLETRLASFILQNTEDGIFQSSLLECSELIATSYRHLLRMMKDFCDRGMLKKEKQKYLVVDEKKLREIASEPYRYYG
jgi:CRP/FNR family putative post-exponential-phase nitrogen-starvation transcriptional regulator